MVSDADLPASCSVEDLAAIKQTVQELFAINDTHGNGFITLTG